MFRPAVFVVHVVGVLPDIDGQRRNPAVGDRRVGVRTGLDPQPASVGDEPRPSTAELPRRGVDQGALGSFEPAQIPFDRQGDAVGWTRLLGRQAPRCGAPAPLRVRAAAEVQGAWEVLVRLSPRDRRAVGAASCQFVSRL